MERRKLQDQASILLEAMAAAAQASESTIEAQAIHGLENGAAKPDRVIAAPGPMHR